MEKVTSSHEDYLEAIVMLGATTEEAIRSVDVATMLDVSKASVNKAVSVLKEEGFVEQSYYGGITLTEQGFAYGNSVLRRHRTFFLFMTKVLGIPKDVAYKEACAMEHIVSDDSFEKWFNFIEGFDLCFI